MDDLIPGGQTFAESPIFAGFGEGPVDLAAGLASAGSQTFAFLIQDLSYAEFLELADLIADRLVFPLWFRRIPICFFSWLGREAYESPPIKGEDLHNDFARVIRALASRY
jgi:hypothetical protein